MIRETLGKGDMTVAMRSVNKMYLDAKRQYSDKVPIVTPRKRRLGGIDAYKDSTTVMRTTTTTSVATLTTRGLHSLGDDALQWWRDNQQHYPV